MAVSTSDLEKLAELKVKLRKTDLEAAEYFGVSQRTIQRWLKTSQYSEFLINNRADQLESAKDQVASLADDIIATLGTLMRSSRSDLVKMQSAQILGKWLGLDEMKESAKADDRDEIKNLLKQISGSYTPPMILPPPLPGGALPQSYIDAIIVPAQEEKREEREEGERGAVTEGGEKGA
jgi:hypothetical protein